ncbi:hypothetical protein AcetOrient_orf02822 [Acetobacter orientalis]|uniref:Uncharacterized protein n=1 Tax=Acetobacter orientalis TaxID=146474 RepID=A0A2Z5ZI41_9PROT|nr:hypothetical protein AcetOrient_orf02822 [Acetobacter orientalis]
MHHEGTKAPTDFCKYYATIKKTEIKMSFSNDITKENK